MAKPTGATIGFIGMGEVSARTMRSLLNDQYEAHQGELRFIIPVTKAHFNDGIQAILDWGMSKEVPYEIVVDESTDKMKGIKDYVANAVREHRVQRIPHKIVNLLEKAPGAKLFVLWHDDDDDAYKAFERAVEHNVPAFDFTNGLEELAFEDDTTEEVAAEEEYVPQAAPEMTEEQRLMKLPAAELRQLCAERSIEVHREGPGRISKETYVQALLSAPQAPAGAAAVVEDEVPPTTTVKGSRAKKGQKLHDEVTEALMASPSVLDDEDEFTEVTVGVMIDHDDDEDDTGEEETAAILADAETMDAIAEGLSDLENDDTEIYIPAVTDDEEEGVNVLSDEAVFVNGQAVVVPERQWSLVGNCNTCGGPIFGHGLEEPEVRWYHASKCTLG